MTAIPSLFPLGRIEPQEPTRVYHYTSLETMMKIVDSRQLWATSVKFLNDTAERTAFLDVAVSRLASYRDSHTDVDREAFDDALDSQSRILEGISYLPSVVSFSRDWDSLPQWRAYSPRGRGVAIGFSVEALKRAKVASSKREDTNVWFQIAPSVKYGSVSYLRALAAHKVDEAIVEAYSAAQVTYKRLDQEERGSTTLGDYFRSTLEDRATFFKDGSFESENEFRLVASGVYWRLDLLHYRFNDWSMVPYLKLNIPNPDGASVEQTQDAVEKRVPWQAIEAVYIGPTADKHLTADAVQTFFHSRDMNVNVQTTNIPFRDW